MIGKTINHYEILEKLGQGGMGVVYKAHDSRLKRPVALKFLPPEFSTDEEAKQRFIHEAQAASALEDNHICTIFEIGETDEGQFFISMPLYEGRTLKEVIEDGPLPLEKVIHIALQIGKGLSAAHARDIVHRDIKPANIFITRNDEVKILDFGLAKVSGQTQLTKAGSTLGTAAYMSPEQTTGAEVDHRTDIWALGVILYEMLCGVKPFKGDYDQAVIYSILNEDPVAPCQLNENIPDELETELLRLLAREPAERIQTMQEVVNVLEEIGGDKNQKTTLPLSIKTTVLKTIISASVIISLILVFMLNIGGLRDYLIQTVIPTGTIKLAVLPFANLSAEEEQEYFSDGITEEMISELGRLHPTGLSVIGRTSVLRYKKSQVPINEIGKELDVDYIVEGSTRREGETIRINAKLINVQDQIQLWGESYNRGYSEILMIQKEVAQRIAEALALQLLPEEQLRLTHVRFVDPEAHDLYLKGFQHWKHLTRKELEMAMRYFNLALEKDSTYAPVYVGIALVWAGLQQMGYLPMSEAGPISSAYALKAIDLDENSAEAHFALAATMSWIEWRWEDAGPVWKRAIELNPSNETAQAYYGHYLAIMGKTEKALRHSRLALELDPFNSLIYGLHAGVLNFCSQFAEAEYAARKSIEFQMDSPIGNGQLGLAFLGQKRDEDFIALRRKRYKNNPELLDVLEKNYNSEGIKGVYRVIADYGANRYQEKGGRVQWIGQHYFYAGEFDRAVDWFEEAFKNREGNLPYISRPYFYNVLRSNSRYLDLLRKMGIPAIR